VRVGFIRLTTMAADLSQFQQLLNTLLSTDNDARTQAEVRKIRTFFIYIENLQARKLVNSPTASFVEHVVDVLPDLTCGVLCIDTVCAIA
jgi:hypothetical protein